MSTALGIALGLLSAVVFGVAAVVQARAARGMGSAANGLGSFVAVGLHIGGFWITGFAYLAGFVLHAGAITLLPLFLAQAMIAMQLPVTAVVGGRIESALGGRLWGAVAAVSLGLVLLTAASGSAGDVARPLFTAVADWCGLVVLGVVGLFAHRLSGSVLAVAAGLGYAATALSVRGLTTPVGAAVVAILVSMPVYSVVAFWLYSVAMRRARVAATSASLIVVQTLVPAAVGLLALGDRVREGWWPAIAVGLALAVAGAIVASRSRISVVSSDPGAGTGSGSEVAGAR